MSSLGRAIGKVVGGITGASDSAKGAERAARIQAASAQAGIDEQRRQFDALIELMTPFIDAGTGAIDAQQDLIGLSGPQAQQEAIDTLSASPQFLSLVDQSEESLLQNASATGGLRGGNIRNALAQFRPQILSQLMESQFNKLGQLSHMGQASAAGQGAAGLQVAGNIGNLLNQQGAARAGGVMAKANVPRQAFQDLMGIVKTGAQADLF